GGWCGFGRPSRLRSGLRLGRGLCSLGRCLRICRFLRCLCFGLCLSLRGGLGLLGLLLGLGCFLLRLGFELGGFVLGLRLGLLGFLLRLCLGLGSFLLGFFLGLG